MRRGLLALLLLAGLAGSAAAQQADDWRWLASDADRARLRGWRTAWMTALAAAPAAVKADTELFDPDRALDDAMPPLGGYRCRVHPLGSGKPALPWGRCRIEEDKGLRRLVAEEGAQRAVGHLYPDTAPRAVFLGTLAIGDERRALRYGRDRRRDLAGVVERIGDRRWRLVFPATSFGSGLDIMELVPG